MSIESAKAFLERVENDENFRTELEGKTSEEERIKFAKVLGFDFTKDKISEVKDSLIDEQLEAVAGGVGKSWRGASVCIDDGCDVQMWYVIRCMCYIGCIVFWSVVIMWVFGV